MALTKTASVASEQTTQTTLLSLPVVQLNIITVGEFWSVFLSNVTRLFVSIPMCYKTDFLNIRKAHAAQKGGALCAPVRVWFNSSSSSRPPPVLFPCQSVFEFDPADRFPWKLCYGNKYICLKLEEPPLTSLISRTESAFICPDHFVFSRVQLRYSHCFSVRLLAGLW